MELRNYRNLVLATRDGIDQRWHDPKTLARQKEILDSSLRFLQEVLHPEKNHPPDLTVYCQRMGPLVLANASDAARAEIDATHAQMMRWKKELTREEWSRLQVIVIGSQMPRRGNLDVQYFAHLLGLKGEGPRLTYAEGLWEEPAALRLLGTRLADQEPGDCSSTMTSASPVTCLLMERPNIFGPSRLSHEASAKSSPNACCSRLNTRSVNFHSV